MTESSKSCIKELERLASISVIPSADGLTLGQEQRDGMITVMTVTPMLLLRGNI